MRDLEPDHGNGQQNDLRLQHCSFPDIFAGAKLRNQDRDSFTGEQISISRELCFEIDDKSSPANLAFKIK
jgi:hypothetical protein